MTAIQEALTRLYQMQMYKLLGRSVIPFLTVATAVWVYGIVLPILVGDPTDRGRQIAASVCIWVFSVIYLWFIASWFLHALQSRERASGRMVRAFFDVLISHYHVTAALALSLWLMDAAINKDTYWTGIPSSSLTDIYGVYVGDFLHASTLLLNSAGYGALLPRSSSVLPAIWSMYVSFSGVLLIVFLLGVLIQHFLQGTHPPSGAVAYERPSSTTMWTSKRFNSIVRPRVYTTEKLKK